MGLVMSVLSSTPTILGMALGLVLTLPGCDHDDPFDPSRDGIELDPDASPRSGGDWGCRTCGYTNSPFLGQLPLDRFTVAGGPFSSQLELSAALDPTGQSYPVKVDAGQFVAHGPTGLVQGAGLVGWSLVFTDEHGEQRVTITAFAVHPDWVGGDPIFTYGLAHADPLSPDGTYVNVCPGLSPDETTVVLLNDELYDMATKEVTPDQWGWVTMACRGHALAKLALLGYGRYDAYQSTPPQRQAALKAITADYCGDGTSFTVVGQPLEWADELGNFRVSDLSPDSVVEARWSEDGAVCLNAPRLVPRAEVEAQCSLPWCDDDLELDGARWLTALPAKP
jgi:hypothetical protein